MANLEVTTRDGAHHSIDAINGSSVMEALRDSGVTNLVAMCGGCCSCATCHVVIDPQWMPKVGEVSAEEDDMMSDLVHRTATSRLSCQIIMSTELDGLHLEIASEE
jgi:2Fe-2S ferredoxin